MTHIKRINEMHPSIYLSAADKREAQISKTPKGVRKYLPKHILESPKKLRTHAQKMDKTPKTYELILTSDESLTSFNCDYNEFEWVDKSSWINSMANTYEACYLTKDDIKEVKNNKENSYIEYKFNENSLKDNIEYPFVLVYSGGWNNTYCMLLLDIERATPVEWEYDVESIKFIATKYQLYDGIIDFSNLYNGHNEYEVKDAEQDWDNMIHILMKK